MGLARIDMPFFFSRLQSPINAPKHILAIILCALVIFISPKISALEASSELPSVESIEALIEQVKNDARLDELQKKQKIAQLQLALKNRDAALELKRQAKVYADAQTNAVKQAKEVETKLKSLKEQSLPKSVRRSALEKLEALVTKNDAELAALRKQLVLVNTEIKNEKAFDIQVALDEARQALQLQTVDSSNEQTDEISQILNQISLNLQQSEIDNLEQRLLSRNNRLSLWELQQKLFTKQIGLLENKLAKIRVLVTNHRQSEANQIIRQSQEFFESLGEQPKLILDLAEQNIALAEQLNKLVGDQDQVINDKERATLETQEIQQKFTSLTEQLAISHLGSSPEFGSALRKQRDQIIDESKARKFLKVQKQALTDARLAQFKVDASREVDQTLELRNLMTALGAESDPLVNEKQPLLQTILNNREVILEKLSAAYWNYIGNLTSLTLQNSALITLNREYADLLDQQLLWMPSSNTVNLETVKQLPLILLQIDQEKIADKLTGLLHNLLQSYPVFIGFIALITLLLLQRRSKLILILNEMKDRVGKVNRDKIGLTLVAILVTFLLALPGPLLLISLAYLLSQFNLWTDSLAAALAYAALVYLFLNFAQQSARDNGLLLLHLKWQAQNVKNIRRNLHWFIAIIVPVIAINSLIESSGDAVIRDNIGRLTFMLETFTTAFFFHRIFPSFHSPEEIDNPENSADLAEWVYRYLRFSLIILAPLFLVGFSLYGYHYSAVQLENRLINSALVILAGVFSYYIIIRAFAINERKLALERLRAIRAAALAAKNLSEEEIEDSEEHSPSAIELQEIDLQSISKQTRTLVKLLFTVAAFVALWNVWSEIFPAFKPLVNVELWQVQELNDGVLADKSITLWDLLLSIIILIITYLAAKNISGLLDIVLLSRVSLQPGSSYTIATITQYAIVIVGSVIAIQGLGAQWSKLQWLIAALSVGLGFGLQEMVANFVSGIVILFERPFRIGDTVTVGDQWGTVSKIRIRATTIVDWDRREMIVPNKTFIQERLTNWTLSDAITRRKINVGVAYGSDVELVENLLLKIAHENPKVLDEPRPEALFVSFGESTLDFCLRIFVKGHREHASVAHEIHKAIDYEFRQNRIEIAFPQRDIHFDSTPISVSIVDQKTPGRHESRRQFKR